MRLLGILLVATAVCGCAANRIAVGDSAGLAAMNDELAGRTVIVVTQDGREIWGRDLEVVVDEASWADASSGFRESLATSAIRSITIRRPGRGALKGLLWGGAIATGFSIAEYYSDQNFLAFFVLPPLGALGGIIVGELSDADVYEIRFPLIPVDAESR
jgi:hypothetical protein